MEDEDKMRAIVLSPTDIAGICRLAGLDGYDLDADPYWLIYSIENPYYYDEIPTPSGREEIARARTEAGIGAAIDGDVHWIFHANALPHFVPPPGPGEQSSRIDLQAISLLACKEHFPEFKDLVTAVVDEKTIRSHAGNGVDMFVVGIAVEAINHLIYRGNYDHHLNPVDPAMAMPENAPGDEGDGKVVPAESGMENSEPAHAIRNLVLTPDDIADICRTYYLDGLPAGAWIIYPIAIGDDGVPLESFPEQLSDYVVADCEACVTDLVQGHRNWIFSKSGIPEGLWPSFGIARHGSGSDMTKPVILKELADDIIGYPIAGMGSFVAKFHASSNYDRTTAGHVAALARAALVEFHARGGGDSLVAVIDAKRFRRKLTRVAAVAGILIGGVIPFFADIWPKTVPEPGAWRIEAATKAGEVADAILLGGGFKSAGPTLGNLASIQRASIAHDRSDPDVAKLAALAHDLEWIAVDEGGYPAENALEAARKLKAAAEAISPPIQAPTHSNAFTIVIGPKTAAD